MTDVMSEEKHPCPFERCTCAYKKKKGVKDHLIQIVGTEGYDDAHKQDDPLWPTLKADGYLQVLLSKAIDLTFGFGCSQREFECKGKD